MPDPRVNNDPGTNPAAPRVSLGGSSLSARFAAGLSGYAEPATAADQACEACRERLGAGPVDLAVVFFSAAHVDAAAGLTTIVRRKLSPSCLIGVSAESVMGGRIELERVAGLSILAARLPGCTLTPFQTDRVLPLQDGPEGLARLAGAIGAGPSLRATMLFADPFSVPTVKLLPALNHARAVGADGSPLGHIIGGMASAGRGPGGNALILNDRIYRAGGVGVSISGHIEVDAFVSQGCRPFGPNLVVTKAKGNVIFQLGNRPALEVVNEAIEELGEGGRELLQSGLFIGRVINEYKDRFGRGDFLIRSVIGIDQANHALAVGDLMRVGQTVRLHVRDAATADEDLGLLLDAQKLKPPPVGCLAITCNGRGTRLFDDSHHDAAAICRAFDPPESGEHKAKGGKTFGGDDPTVPLAGFFAGGEIGPVGDQSFMHGHSTCVAVFRRPAPETEQPK